MTEESTNQSLALALYNYNARNATELSFKKNEVFRIVSKDDSGWWKGEKDGKQGLFPHNYVKLLPRERVIAKHAFKPSDESLYLKFEKGDELDIIAKVDAGWWKAKKGDRSGLIPSNYVIPLSTEKKEVASASTRTKEEDKKKSREQAPEENAVEHHPEPQQANSSPALSQRKESEASMEKEAAPEQPSGAIDKGPHEDGAGADDEGLKVVVATVDYSALDGRLDALERGMAGRHQRWQQEEEQALQYLEAQLELRQQLKEQVSKLLLLGPGAANNNKQKNNNNNEM